MLEIIFIRMLGYKSSRIAINIDVNNQDIEDSVKEYKYRKDSQKNYVKNII